MKKQIDIEKLLTHIRPTKHGVGFTTFQANIKFGDLLDDYEFGDSRYE